MQKTQGLHRESVYVRQREMGTVREQMAMVI